VRNFSTLAKLFFYKSYAFILPQRNYLPTSYLQFDEFTATTHSEPNQTQSTTQNSTIQSIVAANLADKQTKTAAAAYL
jgi:hypothetical protein